MAWNVTALTATAAANNLSRARDDDIVVVSDVDSIVSSCVTLMMCQCCGVVIKAIYSYIHS